MPGGRHTTPLFDLLTRRQPAATPAAAVRASPVMEVAPAVRPAKPVVRVGVRPRRAPHAPPEPGAAPSWSAGLRMPTNVVYIAVALMGTLLVVAWIAGWKLGQTHQAQKDEPLIQRKGPAITEAGLETPTPADNALRGPGSG